MFSQTILFEVSCSKWRVQWDLLETPTPENAQTDRSESHFALFKWDPVMLACIEATKVRIQGGAMGLVYLSLSSSCSWNNQSLRKYGIEIKYVDAGVQSDDGGCSIDCVDTNTL